MFGQLVPIERKDGVTLYGRIIGKGGKLGQFQVYSPHLKDREQVYHTYSEAKTRMNAMIGVKNS